LKDLVSGSIEQLNIDANGDRFGTGGTNWSASIDDKASIVVFQSQEKLSSNDTSSLNDIYARNLSTGVITLISSEQIEDSWYPLVSPDGSRVYYRTNDQSGTLLRIKNLDSGLMEVLSEPKNTGAFSSEDFTATANNGAIFWTWKDYAETDEDNDADYYQAHLQVRYLDQGGEATLAVIPVNDAPTAILIDGNSLIENSAGSIIGTLTVTDPDVDSYSSHGSTPPSAVVVTPAGAGDGVIDTHVISTAAEGANSVTTADVDGDGDLDVLSASYLDDKIAWYDLNLSSTTGVNTLDFNNLNLVAGDRITLTIVGGTQVQGVIRADGLNGLLTTLATNVAAQTELFSGASASNGVLTMYGLADGTALPEVTTTAPAQTHHTLDLSGADADAFEIVDGQLKLKDSMSADHETKSSYSVTVTATDSGNLSFSEDMIITVSDVNEAPTDITLSSSTMEENSATGTVVGDLSATDPDAADTHSFSVVGGTGSSLFEINANNELVVKSGAVIDYETLANPTVTILTTDSGGLTFDKTLTVSVITQETFYGSAGNDVLDGFSGYDIIDGQGGLDTAKYSVASTKVFARENEADQLVIYGSAGQSETVVDIERFQFTDKVYALDLDGNAGVAAKAIIVSFGADSLNAYMSAALSIVDSGTSLESLCDLVVDLELIDQLTGSSSNSSFVGHLFQNVVGRSPNLFENAIYTNRLDNGTYTKSSLLALAANTTLAEDILTANSVDLIGVPGSADGELLAIRYDIGLG